MINEDSLKVLEYDKLLMLILGYASSRPGKLKILDIKPNIDINEVKILLDLTREADRLMYEMCINVSFAVDDISEILELVHKGVTLNCEQLLKIAKVLKVARIAKKNIINTPENDFILLKEYVSRIFIAHDIEDNINRCILSENEVSSNASQKLATIRQSIVSTNRKIREKLNSYISSNTYSNYMQDNLVTIRNNRYVIPVKTEYKGAIKGLIHDQSSTGATTYIEPIAIVELNNELRSLEIEEQIEVENILRNLSYDIDASYYEINETYKTIIELDVIFAKALYSKNINGIYPNINSNGIIDIIDGRHPLIDSNKVVPVSISLGLNYDTLLISGPNTGGKTVSLKLVGTLSLLTMIGVFIPAKEGSTINVFDNILCDIGDAQSIENNLSTFSSHLVNLVNITNITNNNTLVLLDELGAGTDPIEGAALAISIIEFLRNKHSKIIVTSHYKELKEYAYATDKVNISGMDFDPNTYKPTYKLIMGLTGTSNALEVASTLGLNKEIILKAKSLISEEDNSFNNIIKGAEIARREAILLKEEIEQQLNEQKNVLNKYNILVEEVEKKKEKLDEKLAKSAKEVLGDYLIEAEELLEELKEKVKEGDEKALFEARTTFNKLKNIKVESKEKIHYVKDSSEINIGDDVYVKSLNKIGTIMSISSNKKECTVKMGVLTTLVKTNNLQKVIIENKKEFKPNIQIRQQYDLSYNITKEINLIGKRCDDALHELEDYIYKAKSKGYSEIRIVHGKGAGILRNAVHEYLNTLSFVDKYRLGEYGEGDYGVTIVTFKL